MSREETAERLKAKFLDKGLKEEAMIVLTALSADLPEDKVEQYMTTDLNADQLIEMMVAIMDGLPDATLELFAGGTVKAEDMRTYRLGSWGDARFQTLSEQIMEVKELAEELRTSDSGQAKISKSLRELKSEISAVRGCVESIEERLKKEGQEMSKGNETPVEIKPEKVTNTPEAHAKRLSAYQALFAKQAAKEAGEAAATPEKPLDYITKDGMVISREPVREENKRGILSIFRRVNEGRVGTVSSATEKRKAINKIVALGLEEDKLKALSVGARAGVDP